MTAATALPYVYKPSPSGSHVLLIESLPRRGEGRRVLDVGCGPGYLAEILAGRGYRVTGIDRPDVVSRSAPATVELIAADVDRGAVPVAGGFSYILCGDVLEHVRDPLRLLHDLRTLLEPDGLLIASLPNSGNFYFRLNVVAGRFPSHDRGLFDRTHLHFYTWDGWVELLSRGGFEPQNLVPTGVPVGLALPRCGTALVRLLERLCWGLACLWKELFAYQFVVVARPRTAT